MTNIVYSSVAFWILVKDDGGWVDGSVAESVKALKAYNAMNKPECHRFCTRLCKQVKATNHLLVIKYSRSGCFVRLHILCQEATTTASCAIARGS